MLRANYVKSQKGKDLLNIRGYLFVKNSTRDDVSYWKCTKRVTLNCSAFAKTVSTDDDTFVKSDIEQILHNHLPEPQCVDKLMLINSLKCKADESMDNPSQIAQSVLKDVPSTSAPYLPNKNAMRQIVNRIRRNNTKSSTFLHEIPEEMAKINDKIFLHFNDEIDGIGRILIFTTEENLRHLDAAQYWIMDGTFRCTSDPFLQLYTIHALVGNDVSRRTIPLVYALLPCKTEDCYNFFFNELRNCGALYDLDLCPDYIITDFEMATINACRRVFDRSVHKGCFFHFTQNVWKQIKTLGLDEEYGRNSEFALKLRHLFALAFLPPEDIPPAFEGLKSEEVIPESANDLMEWFDQYYVNGRLTSKNKGPTKLTMKKTKPLFSPQLWSVFDNSNNNMPRTQNIVESWHRRWNTLLNGKKWNLNIMMKELIKEQIRTEQKIQRIIANTPMTPPRKKNKYFEDSLQRIINKREEMDVNEFLRKIAYHYKI